MQLPLGAGVGLYGLDVMCPTQAHMFEHFGSQLAELFWEVVEMCVCGGLARGSDCQMVGFKSYSQPCLQPRLSPLHDVIFPYHGWCMMPFPP